MMSDTTTFTRAATQVLSHLLHLYDRCDAGLSTCSRLPINLAHILIPPCQPPPPSPLRPSSRGASPAPSSQLQANGKPSTPRIEPQSGSLSQRGSSPVPFVSPRLQQHGTAARFQLLQLLIDLVSREQCVGQSTKLLQISYVSPALESGSPRANSIMRLTASSLCKVPHHIHKK